MGQCGKYRALARSDHSTNRNMHEQHHGGSDKVMMIGTYGVCISIYFRDRTKRKENDIDAWSVVLFLIK
jgi:hypothetical protein